MKFVTVLGAALFLVAATGCGDDADVVACEGKSQGDACTDDDGRDGVCQPDDGTDVLECDDDIPPR